MTPTLGQNDGLFNDDIPTSGLHHNLSGKCADCECAYCAKYNALPRCTTTCDLCKIGEFGQFYMHVHISRVSCTFYATLAQGADP